MPSRRTVLALLVGGLVSVAGCADQETSHDSTGSSDSGDESDLPPELLTCSSTPLPAEGDPITLDAQPEEVQPVIQSATPSTQTPTAEFLKARVRDVYDVYVSNRVSRQFETVSIGVADQDTSDGSPAIILTYRWNDRMSQDELVDFQLFKRDTPSAITAPVTVDQTQYTATVPIYVACDLPGAPDGD
jgi:hypothetical protein